jgi:apolipoprotein N-acyltransferase
VLLFPRRRRPATMALIAAVLAAAMQNGGTIFRGPVKTGSQKAILLQPNLSVGVEDGRSAEMLALSGARLTLQASALTQEPARILLWPESPAPFQTDRQDFTAAASALTEAAHAPLIAGAVGVQLGTQPGATRIFNSAALFLPGRGYVTRYDKVHLVPFGEYVPYASVFRFAGGLTQAVGSFERGAQRQPLAADGHRYGVFLCYESIFADEVRQFTRGGAEVLTNLSDDGWYGDTSAPFQHLNMARMRAIENHRWLLRDTNNGVTASINPDGRIVETMERHRRGAVAVHFEYLHDLTFYAHYGDLFAKLCVLLSAFVVVVATLRPRNAVN